MAVGEDAYGVGASADFAVEAFIGVVGPDLGPYPGGEGRECEDVCSGLIEVIAYGGELVVDVVQEPVVLRVDRCGVGLGGATRLSSTPSTRTPAKRAGFRCSRAGTA